MRDLHPTARALLESAQRGEAALPDAARARVHRSVLRRAAAFGTAMATTTSASVAAKTGAITAVLAKPLVSAGVITALAGAAILVARTSTPPVRLAPSRSAPSAMAIERVVPARGVPASIPVEMVAPASVSAPANAASAERSAQPAATASALRMPLRGRPLVNDPWPRPADTSTHEIPGSAANNAPLVDAEAPSSTPAEHLRPPAPLVLELELLHQVRESLRARQPERALHILESNAAVLGGGPLAEEAEAARVSALCQMGRALETRAAMGRFIAAWPDSPLVVQLRSGCVTSVAEGVHAN